MDGARERDTSRGKGTARRLLGRSTAVRYDDQMRLLDYVMDEAQQESVENVFRNCSRRKVFAGCGANWDLPYRPLEDMQ